MLTSFLHLMFIALSFMLLLPAAYTLGFLDCEDISALCSLAMFQSS